jgi:hypothetical protein
MEAFGSPIHGRTVLHVIATFCCKYSMPPWPYYAVVGDQVVHQAHRALIATLVIDEPHLLLLKRVEQVLQRLPQSIGDSFRASEHLMQFKVSVPDTSDHYYSHFG